MNRSVLPTPNFKPQTPAFNGYLIIGDALSFHGKITAENISDLGDWDLEDIKTVEAVKERWSDEARKALKPLLRRLPKVEEWTFVTKAPSQPKRPRTEKKCPPPPRKKRTKWKPHPEPYLPVPN